MANINAPSNAFGPGNQPTPGNTRGKKVKVQRSPAEPGLFIIWFGKTEIAKVPALQLSETIEYIDGRPVL
jgi:hypothetical protein